MPLDPVLLTGIGITTGAVAGLGLLAFRAGRRGAPANVTAPPIPATATSIVPPAIATTGAWPEPTLPVLGWDELLRETGTLPNLAAARLASGLNAATWEGYVLPVARKVAELVQLLPASEAHHHAQPGGLWIHTCETALHAVRLRQGVMLPIGRDADDQARHKHRWTAGVLVAALLHDTGKTVTDLRVRLYGPNHPGSEWNAMAGSIPEVGASDYAVDFPRTGKRDYQAHQRLGAVLLQRLAPAPTLAWIGDDKALLDDLVQYLSGGDCTDNPIAQLVGRAEGESVGRNLAQGPRTRFASARAIPLIERLMDGLRRMLAEGGQLPLNRPGAAGYVFDGDVWFAAARLANALRDYLRANESADGLPGEDKNDRLFDVWQDYGACRTNPESGRALWGGRIEFDDASIAGFELPAMLRFPLDRLYPDPARYPVAMPGRIVPLATKRSAAADRVPAGEETTKNPPDLGTAAAGPGPQGKELSQSQSVRAPSEAPAPTLPPKVAEAIGLMLGGKTAAPSPASTDTVAGAVEPSRKAAVPPAASLPPASEFLSAEDSAVAPPPSPKPARQAARSLAPVAPASPTAKTTDTPGKAPSPSALAFMTWVQRSVADGSLPYNTTGAMVHFVKYGPATALLLVSPSIFRKFAQTEDEGERRENDAPGQAIQRAFSGAGWHLRNGGGKNIWGYQVMRRADQGGNLLNGFLLLDPERFFNPVPPANERLVLWNTATQGKKEAS